jgi:MFS transporter, LAT3 family, solute carrier family 43, member 3
MQSQITAKNILLYLYCFSTTALVAGTIYGYPALRRKLQKLGTKITEEELAACYTAGAWSVQGGRLLFGIMRDKYGTRKIALISFSCVICGACGIAFMDYSNKVLLGVSLFLLGLGSGAQLSVQPVAQIFPRNNALFMSGLSGSFQISGVVFAMLVSVSDLEGSSLKTAFLAYALAVVFMAVLGMWMLPLGASFVKKEDLEEKARVDSIVEVDGKMKVHLTGFEQMKTKEFVGLTIWFTVLVTPFQYYVGSIGWHLERLGDDDGTMTNAFAYVYGLAAVFAPIGGMCADAFGLGVTMAVASVAVGMSFFVLEMDIELEAHSAGMVLYAVGRLICFAMFFSAIGKMFGYKYYGVLAGVGLFTSAVVSTLQYPLIEIAVDGNYKVSNYACGFGCFLAITYCVYVYMLERAGLDSFERLKFKRVAMKVDDFDPRQDDDDKK